MSDSVWKLDPTITFLNHGSFGSCPRAVVEAQDHWRDRLERNPVKFMRRDLEGFLDTTRQQLAGFLGGEARSLAFLRNTTTGVNAILRSLELKPGDEILITSHAYNALRNAVTFIAERRAAKVVPVPVAFPIDGSEQVVEAVLAHVNNKTKLALLEHVTCLTGLVFPIERLVEELTQRGVDVLVDGAHAVGMLPLNLKALGAAYYVGNFHKWVCAPRGSAFLYVDPERQASLRPLTISHGANDPRPTRSRFHLEFDWTGTDDPTPWLTVPAAIGYIGELLPGGWSAVMAHNHALAVEARNIVCSTLDVQPPCPESMMGSLASVLFPGRSDGASEVPFSHDPLQAALYERFKIEVIVVVWPNRRRLLRLSAHLYNTREQYARLADALTSLKTS